MNTKFVAIAFCAIICSVSLSAQAQHEGTPKHAHSQAHKAKTMVKDAKESTEKEGKPKMGKEMGKTKDGGKMKH